MKKTISKKKLVVSHATIRTLTEPDLVTVAGGMDSLVSFKPASCSSCPRYTC